MGDNDGTSCAHRRNPVARGKLTVGGEGEGCWSKVLEGGRGDGRQDTRGWAVDQRTDNSAVGTRERAAGRQEDVVGVSGRSLEASLFSVKREARAPVGSEEGKELEVGGRRRGKLKWKRAAEREGGQAGEVCAPEAPGRPGQDD